MKLLRKRESVPDWYVTVFFSQPGFFPLTMDADVCINVFEKFATKLLVW
jgi:hypothetical protein